MHQQCGTQDIKFYDGHVESATSQQYVNQNDPNNSYLIVNILRFVPEFDSEFGKICDHERQRHPFRVHIGVIDKGETI